MDKSEEFEEYFKRNYNTLTAQTKNITGYYDHELIIDFSHDAYIKIKSRIEDKGYEGKNFGGYYYRVVQNLYHDHTKDKRKKKNVGIDDYFNTTEHKLHEIDEDHKNSEEYMNQVYFLTPEMFKFLEINFTDKENHIFRSYYLVPKTSYAVLSKRIGYSISYCSQVIKKMKKSLRKDFINWLNDKYGNNE